MFDWLRRFNPTQYLKYRGKRIRPKDKHLVLSTFLSILSPLFFGEILFIYRNQVSEFFKSTDPILERLNHLIQKTVWTQFLIISLLAICSCLLIAYSLFITFHDWYRQLKHRQKIATMILQNHWYETESVQQEGFFKDLSSSRSKEKITYFPKVFYQMKQGFLIVSVEISLNSYQEQLLYLEKKLESGLYCELVDKELEESFVVYTLLYDAISNRIMIDEVEAKNGPIHV